MRVGLQPLWRTSSWPGTLLPLAWKMTAWVAAASQLSRRHHPHGPAWSRRSPSSRMYEYGITLVS